MTRASSDKAADAIALLHQDLRQAHALIHTLQDRIANLVGRDIAVFLEDEDGESDHKLHIVRSRADDREIMLWVRE